MSTLLHSPCARCGATLHATTLDGECPRCLMASALSGGYDEIPSAIEEGGLIAPIRRAEDVQIGSRLGDFELVDVLGRGGMAVVYLARQVSLDRLVALKMIAALKASDPPTQERFRREAKSVAQLDHPGIVSIHEAGSVDGALYYTMDYVEGSDLGRVLRQRQLPVREAADLMRRVAEAVGHAHRQGIVHRDLKPANVLIDSSGEPRVTDFGLAMESETGTGGLTLTGDLLGTPPYMAPEMLAGGASKATPAADVYALGAMLFQILTGRTPFLGESPSQLLHLVINEEPPSLRLLNPTVPRDLQTICLKCLGKAPASRYADGRELGADLGRFLADEPIRARPASPAVRLMRWSRRRPGLATFIAALTLFAVGGALAAFAINSGRERAVHAEGDAREQLWRANLAHAESARRNSRAGARAEALRAIADAAQFHPSIQVRNEAIAALALQDAVVERSWNVPAGLQSEVAFEPSQRSYIAELKPGLLVRYDAADSREIGRFEIAGQKVAGVPVFSPDGRYLAVRYADKVVRVWEVSVGRIAFELTDRPSPVLPNRWRYGVDITFSPDSKQLIVGVWKGGFSVHEMPGGGELRRWTSTTAPRIIRFSPDNHQIAVADESPVLHLLDAVALTELRTITLPSAAICAAWSPDSNRLALGTRASRIHVASTVSGEVIDTIPVSGNGGAGQLLFHPRLPILAGTSSDETVRLWDINAGGLLLQIDDAGNRPVLTFNQGGTQLSVYNATQHRASLVTIQPSPIFHAPVPPAQMVPASLSPGALGLSPDGRWLVSSSFGLVQLRDAGTGEVVQTIKGFDNQDMMTAQFAPDGRSLFVCSLHSGLSRVVVVSNDEGLTFEAPELLDNEGGLSLAEIAGNGRLLLVGWEKPVAIVFDPARRDASVRLSVPKISSACFTPDGNRVLTVGGETLAGEAAVKVWEFLGPGGPQMVASFGDDVGGRAQCAGPWVLTTGTHKTELRRYGSWQPGAVIPAELQGDPHHARLSPDGNWLAIEKDHEIYLLAAATGETVARFQGTGNPAGVCLNELFSADSSRLSLLWLYGAVHVWDLEAMHRELDQLGLDWLSPKGPSRPVAGAAPIAVISRP